MRVATQSQVTTKVSAIKNALNSFNYSHKCIYYYSNNTINSSWSTPVTLPNDGFTYKIILCYTFSANPNSASSSSAKAGMIIDLVIGNQSERIVQGFSSSCYWGYAASKNNISTGMITKSYTGSGQTIPVSIALNFVGQTSTLQEEPNLSGFQLAVMKIPMSLSYERA